MWLVPLAEICPASKSSPKVAVPSLDELFFQGLRAAPYIGGVGKTERKGAEMATKDKWMDQRPWEDPFPDQYPNANGYGRKEHSG